MMSGKRGRDAYLLAGLLGGDMNVLLAPPLGRGNDYQAARCPSARYEYQPAGNLPAPQLLQDFVDLRQGTRGRLAADFSCGGHG
jgi:hypothetical protein